METKLLPCPFCGGEAELDEYCGKYVVFCKNASCSWRKTEAEAIEAWNTRAERTCRWKHTEGTWFMSECGERYDRVIPDNYCPNCGAKVVSG